MKMTLNEINIARKNKNLDRILWTDYETMTDVQKEKLIVDTK